MKTNKPTIPLMSEVQEVIEQAIDGLRLPESVAEPTNWSETPSGQCFVTYTAPSGTWAHQLGSAAKALFGARGQPVDELYYNDSGELTIQVQSIVD